MVFGLLGKLKQSFSLRNRLVDDVDIVGLASTYLANWPSHCEELEEDLRRNMWINLLPPWLSNPEQQNLPHACPLCGKVKPCSTPFPVCFNPRECSLCSDRRTGSQPIVSHAPRAFHWHGVSNLGPYNVLLNLVKSW